jgi:hypothetical protein
MDFVAFEQAALKGKFEPRPKPSSLYACLSGPE